MLFTPFFVFIYPAAQFILLLYLIGFQKSHCEEYLKKDSRSYYHLCYQEEELHFNRNLLKLKHARENQKQEIKRNISIAMVTVTEATQHVFQQMFLKQKKYLSGST